jgi:hypothetical protein
VRACFEKSGGDVRWRRRVDENGVSSVGGRSRWRGGEGGEGCGPERTNEDEDGDEDETRTGTEASGGACSRTETETETETEAQVERGGARAAFADGGRVREEETPER